jgi:hypothetical protein
MHYLQPDYIIASKGDLKRFWNVGFWWPRFHDSDHRAVITTIHTGRRQLKGYRKHQEFPLQLHLHEQQDELTKAFKALKVACKEPETTKHHWRNWMSESTWGMVHAWVAHFVTPLKRTCDEYD